MATLTAKGQQRQQEILAAADELFRENGYENTTLRMIAQDVGISCGHLEHYFKEKRVLLNHLSELLIHNIWDISEEISKEWDGDPYVTYAFAVHWLFLIGSHLPDVKRITLEYVRYHDNLREFSEMFGKPFIDFLGLAEKEEEREKVRIAVNMAFAAQISRVQEFDDEQFTEETAKVTAVDHIKIMYLLLGRDINSVEKISEQVWNKICELSFDRLTTPFEKTYRWYVIEEHPFEI